MSGYKTPEFDLVAACCRWPQSPERTAAIRQVADTAIDWSRFERVVARHRVVGLVHDGVQQAEIVLPPGLSNRIAADATKQAQTALEMARESLRLQSAFAAANVPTLCVKGSALAMLAYGQLGIKQSWDIDLLTTPERAKEGRHLLQQLGYVLELPNGLSDIQFDGLVDVGKEAVFRHRESGIWVELHWRLIDNQRLLQMVRPFGAVQSVPFGGAALTTLDDDALFAYLCVHGTAHGWARLKWLADVAAFISGRVEADIQRLYHSAIALGAGRGPTVALHLCQHILKTDLPPSLQIVLDRDRAGKHLANTSVFCLKYGNGEREFDVYSLPGLMIQISQLFIGGTARYFFSELHRKWTSTQDRSHIILPKKLTFLYNFLRLPLWLSRQVGRVARKLN